MIAPNETSRPWIVDTTLRDGEQAPGAAFSDRQKITLAGRLAAAGVDELEIGTPAMGQAECQVMHCITRLNLPARTTVWCRATSRDIHWARKTRADGIHLSIPVSAVQLSALGKDEAWALESLTEAVSEAGEYFGFISVGLQDASRVERHVLAAWANYAKQLGVHRLRLADTVGVWHPQAVQDIFHELRGLCGDMQLGFHGHNDLGMATANSIAALCGGADSVDVTVNGLGERAGNAPLAEVVMAANVALGRSPRVAPSHLAGLSRMVAEWTSRPISPTAPVVGEDVFRHESGIHVRGVIASPSSYEPYAPESVGAGRRIVIGKHSGTTAVRHVLAQAGLDISAHQAQAMLSDIRRVAQRCGGALNVSDLLHMAKKHFGEAET